MTVQERPLSQEEGARPLSSKPSLAAPKPGCVPDTLPLNDWFCVPEGALGFSEEPWGPLEE